ncbi:uncharacterized protein LOC143853943 [Tasmannia lanceolata]|uniref:uncharacterized protein LOC143853943 n=1 Tax=Tasmannia lanceolata TaxID=3420 RepID=UPI004063B3EF
MIELVDDSDIDDDGESDHEDADQEGNGDTVVISVHALAGYSTPQTMRVNGYIKRQPVTILIDSGSTNNFLDVRIAKRLSCLVENSDKFEVKVANGRTLTSTGKCSNMKIFVQDQELVTDLFLLPLDGCDIVLGAQWLLTLGDITWNFSKLIMQFSLNGKRVTIKGKGGGSVTTISNHRMEKLVQKEHEVFLVQLQRLESFETATEAEEMEVLLLEFAELFVEPKGLPPKRSHDHRIPVLPGSSPANCDASGIGIGGVLIQESHPLAFISNALSPRHQELSVYDKEMMVIVLAVTKWRPYLIGRHFKILTDHKSLKYIMEQWIFSMEQHKWVSKLMGYDYEIIYKKGAENVVADTLSRIPENASLVAIFVPLFNDLDDNRKEWTCDPDIQNIIHKLHQDPTAFQDTHGTHQISDIKGE